MSLKREIDLILGSPGYGKTSFAVPSTYRHNRVLILEGFTDEDEYSAARVDSLPELLAFFKTKPKKFRVSYNPNPREFNDILRLCWAAGDMHLVIEEAGDYFKKGCNVSYELDQCLRKGRHRQLNMTFISQWPVSIPTDVRRAADKLVCFKLVSDIDRQWCAGFPGATRDLPGEIEQLAKFEYLELTPDGKKTKGKTKARGVK